MPKKTQFLHDNPATADEFGPHDRIASLLAQTISKSQEGRSVALLGDWGSGKSTVVELLKEKLSQLVAAPHVFVYDAWAHQGDSLRRAFLDDFIAACGPLLEKEEKEKAIDQIWNRVELTTITREPILKRHAKLLLVSLAFVPLGMELFSWPNGNSEPLTGLTQTHNILAYFLLLMPVILIGLLWMVRKTNCQALNTFFFGSDNNTSVLSFFFERTQGQIERRQLKSPIDSIQVFRRIFDQLIEFIGTKNKQIHIVIVIDNIDRVPANQAREFWATLQTFFGDSGGTRRAQNLPYWLIVPFSLESLSSVFRDDSAAMPSGVQNRDATLERSKAFVDKTFSLAFRVPPPILTNWRKYLLQRLRDAFPEHEESELIAARDIFDFAEPAPRSVTPRKLKLFVNEIVTLYRQRDSDASLPIIAAYVLHRHQIVGSDIPSNLLSPREVVAVDDADWRILLAALHYGVGRSDAQHLLLHEPIVDAIRKGNAEELKSFENHPGFLDVLRLAASEFLDSQETAIKGTTIATASETIDALESAGLPALVGVWRSLGVRMKTVAQWDSLLTPSANGIEALLKHVQEPEKRRLCEHISRALAAAEPTDPQGDGQSSDPMVKNWVDAAAVVVEATDLGGEVSISLPKSARIKIEALQQIAGAPFSTRVKASFDIAAPKDVFSDALAAEISAGRFLRQPVEFTKLTILADDKHVDWPRVLNAAADRLRIGSIGPIEGRSLVLLLLSVGLIRKHGHAMKVLKELSNKGHLSHLLHQYRKESAALAAILSAILLGNPAFERSGHFEQSESGDAGFNKFTALTDLQPELLAGVGEIVLSMQAHQLLLQLAAQNEKIARVSAAVLNSQSSGTLNIQATEVLTHLEFFMKYHSDLNLQSFVIRLDGRDELFSLTLKQPFEPRRSHLYSALLGFTAVEHLNEFFVFVDTGLSQLEQSDWDRIITEAAGPYVTVLSLCYLLRERGQSIYLPTKARDAALNFVRKVVRKETEISENTKNNFANLVDLLQAGSRRLLVRDLIEDMCSATDPSELNRIIELAGDIVEIGEGADIDRVVLRVFSPLVGHPSEPSVRWMARAIGRRRELLRDVKTDTRTEFGLRLRAALQTKGELSDEILSALATVAEIVGVSISDDANDGEAKSSS